MKKLLLTTLTLLTCGAAYALPVGNPSDASLLCDGLIWEGHCADPCDPCLGWCDALSFRFGFYGDYVFNRHMEVDGGSDDSDIEHTEMYTNAGYLAFNIWDRFELFATLGTTDFFINTNASAFEGIAGNRIEIETQTAFSWSLGARATIWECGCTSLGMEGQYFRTSPDLQRVTVAAATSVYPEDLEATYHEWQVGLGISHRINMFVPYIAVKWSNAKLDFNDTTFADPDVTLLNLQSKKHFGYALGVSLIDCEKASLTVEGRFGDEKALHFNAQIRF